MLNQYGLKDLTQGMYSILKSGLVKHNFQRYLERVNRVNIKLRNYWQDHKNLNKSTMIGFACGGVARLLSTLYFSYGSLNDIIFNSGASTLISAGVGLVTFSISYGLLNHRFEYTGKYLEVLKEKYVCPAADKILQKEYKEYFIDPLLERHVKERAINDIKKISKVSSIGVTKGLVSLPVSAFLQGLFLMTSKNPYLTVIVTELVTLASYLTYTNLAASLAIRFKKSDLKDQT